MKYKNITDQDLTIPEIGLVRAGEVVETQKVISNDNFQEQKAEGVKSSNKIIK